MKDPAVEVLEWLGKDRCLVTFADAKDVKAKLPALEHLIREWIRRLVTTGPW